MGLYLSIIYLSIYLNVRNNLKLWPNVLCWKNRHFSESLAFNVMICFRLDEAIIIQRTLLKLLMKCTVTRV